MKIVKTKPETEIIIEVYCKNCNKILKGHHYGADECSTCHKLIANEKIIYCDGENHHYCKDCYKHLIK